MRFPCLFDFVVDVIYHGNQSSTSSDLSPMSEQKSLPRRGRSRYHAHTYTTNTTPRHKPNPQITAPSPSQQQQHQLQQQHQQLQQQPILTNNNTPTLLVSSSPRSINYSSNNTYNLTPRMPSQFRPIQHRTINIPPSSSSVNRQSPSC